jgi:hypothetical protein
VGTWGVEDAHAVDGEGAVNPNQYSLSVEADGVNFDVHNDSFPLTDEIGASPYSAIATIDSQGTSMALAAAPYFGAFLQPLFHTINGVGPGLIPPFPQVPGYVLSSYPNTPSAKQSSGSYSITADSTADRSVGTVSLGVSQPGSSQGTVHALAHTVADPGGSVAATGESGVDLLSIGGVLTIGNVLSSLVVDQAGSVAPKIRTTTTINGLKVLGVPVGLTSDGITVLGDNFATSKDQVNSALRSALTEAGLSITYLPEHTVTDPATHFVQSTESGALEVTANRDVPGQGTYKIDMIFGRVTASTVDTTVSNVAGLRSKGTAAGDSPSNETGSDTSSELGIAAAAPDNPASSPAGSGAPVDVSPVGSASDSGAQSAERATGTSSAGPDVVNLRPATPRHDAVSLLSADLTGTTADDTTKNVFLVIVLGAGAAPVVVNAARAIGSRARGR